MSKSQMVVRDLLGQLDCIIAHAAREPIAEHRQCVDPDVLEEVFSAAAEARASVSAWMSSAPHHALKRRIGLAAAGIGLTRLSSFFATSKMSVLKRRIRADCIALSRS
jgi:hypothetical protein